MTSHPIANYGDGTESGSEAGTSIKSPDQPACLLSIIIVTYNSIDEISGCLSSVPATLRRAGVETLVVDNASQDGTPDCIRRNFPQVRVIDAGENLGFSKANNRGFDAATGEYILFLNPDTVLNSEALEACLDRLMSEPQIGVISPRLVLANGNIDLACRRSIGTTWDGLTRASGLSRWMPHVPLFSGYNLTYLPEGDTYPVGAVNGAFMLMPRRVLTRIGLFDEQFFMYAEDLDLCLRCTRAGYKVIYDGRHSIIHLKGQSSSKSSSAMSEAVFTSTKLFYLKHFNVRDSQFTRFKFDLLFGLWARVNKLRARLAGHRAARPL